MLGKRGGPVEIGARREGKGLVVSVAGRLDAVSTPDFEKRLLEFVDRGNTMVVIDGGRLNYISSAGLRSILCIAKRLKQGNGILSVAALTGVAKNVFEISGFNAILPIYETVENALEQK